MGRTCDLATLCLCVRVAGIAGNAESEATVRREYRARAVCGARQQKHDDFRNFLGGPKPSHWDVAKFCLGFVPARIGVTSRQDPLGGLVGLTVQAGDNQVDIVKSRAEREASIEFAKAHAVRPRLGGEDSELYQLASIDPGDPDSLIIYDPDNPDARVETYDGTYTDLEAMR